MIKASGKHLLWIIPLMLFVTNFVIKTIGISYNDIAIDEPFSIFNAQKSLPQIFEMLKNENNPPLHFLLLHFWIKLFGISAASVRIISVIASSITVIYIFFIGKKFFNLKTAIFASVIYTLSWFHMYYSHEARVYPIFILLATSSLYYFLNFTEEPSKKKWWLGIIISNVLIIYAHYFGVLIVLCEFISLLFIKNNRKLFLRFFVLFGIILLLYLPNLFTLVERFNTTVSKRNWVPAPHISEFYGNINRFLNSRYATASLIIFLVIFIIWIIVKKQFSSKLKEFSNNTSLKIILIWFVISYVGMFCISFKIPMFLDRYIAYSTIFLYVLIAILFGFLCENKIISYLSMLILSVIMLINFSLYPSNNRNVQELTHSIKSLKLKNPETPVIISPDYANLEFTYYYNINYFKDYSTINGKLNSEKIFPARDLSVLADSIVNNKNLLYLDCGSKFAYGNDFILDKLKESYSIDSIIHIQEIYDIYLFSKNN